MGIPRNIRKSIESERGSVLMLTLVITFLCIGIALWVSHDVSLDLKGSGAQYEFTRYFYAAEAGAQYVVAKELPPIEEAVDGTVRNNIVNVPFGSESFTVDVKVIDRGCTSDCGDDDKCCYKFEVKAKGPYGVLVKLMAIKSVLSASSEYNYSEINPECHVCNN